MSMSREMKMVSFELYWRRDSVGAYVHRVTDIVAMLGLKGTSWLMRRHLWRRLDACCRSCAEPIVVRGRNDLRVAEADGLCRTCNHQRMRAASTGAGMVSTEQVRLISEKLATDTFALRLEMEPGEQREQRRLELIDQAYATLPAGVDDFDWIAIGMRTYALTKALEASAGLAEGRA